MSVTGPKIYFTIPIFGGINITQTTISLFVVGIILCLICWILGRNLQKRPNGTQIITEKLVSMLYKLVDDTMGPGNSNWVPFIGAIFLSSLFGSLIGMTGFLRSTTADLSVTLTWSVSVSAIIWYKSIKANGFLGWLKGFTEPVAVMTPMNIISEIAQPISMAFRQFGNIVGGGVITSILYTALSGVSALVLNAIASSGTVVSIVLLAVSTALIIVGIIKNKKFFLILGIVSAILGLFGLLQALNILSGVPVLAFGIPAILSLYFDLFSGFIQAFVFCLLTMVYISNACPSADE